MCSQLWRTPSFKQKHARVLCSGTKEGDASILIRLIKKTGKVIGTNLDTLESVLQDRMLAKVLLIMNSVAYQLRERLVMQRSALIHPAGIITFYLLY